MNNRELVNELVRVAKLLCGFNLSESEKKRQMDRAEMRIRDAYNREFQKTGDKDSAKKAVTKAILLRISRITEPTKLWGSAAAYEALDYPELAKAAFKKLKELGYDEKGKQLEYKFSSVVVAGDVGEDFRSIGDMYGDYVENEGGDIRIDFGGGSVWLRGDKELEGEVYKKWKPKFNKLINEYHLQSHVRWV